MQPLTNVCYEFTDVHVSKRMLRIFWNTNCINLSYFCYLQRVSNILYSSLNGHVLRSFQGHCLKRDSIGGVTQGSIRLVRVDSTYPQRGSRACAVPAESYRVRQCSVGPSRVHHCSVGLRSPTAMCFGLGRGSEVQSGAADWPGWPSAPTQTAPRSTGREGGPRPRRHLPGYDHRRRRYPRSRSHEEHVSGVGTGRGGRA